MSVPPTEAVRGDGEEPRPGRGELAVLAALAALGLLLRRGAAARVSFYDFDAGLFFARIVEDFGSIVAGTADSQYGARYPVYNMMGFGALVRVVRDLLGLSTHGAGQLVVAASAATVLLLAWALARRLGGPRAGLLAAALVAVDPLEITYSVQSYNVLPCAAFVLGAALLLARAARGGLVAPIVAGLVAGGATWLRADALGAGAVLALRAVLDARGATLPRRSAVAFVVAWLVAAGASVALQRELMRRNGAADYLAHVHADALFNTGRFPDAYFVDGTGLTLRIASEPPSLFARKTSEIAGIVASSAAASGRHLGPLLALGVLALALHAPARRGAAGWLVLLAVALPLFTVLALAPPVDMERYSIASRPALLAVIAAGAVGALDAARRRGGALAKLVGGPAIPVAATAGVLLLAWNPVPAAQGLLAGPGGVRARGEECAAGLATLFPRRTRIAKGPLGDTVLISMAGARPVHMAAGPTPADVIRYMKGDGLEWIVFAEAEAGTVARVLPGVPLERVATFETPDFGPQVLARVRLP